MSAGTKASEDRDKFGFADDEEAEIEYDPEPETAGAEGIEAVRNAYEPEIMAIPGVKGIGITTNAVGDDAIAVYVRDKSVVTSVPRSLGGYDVVAEITGEIDAL